MIDYKDTVDYFENLATLNADLAHQKGVNGKECFLEGDFYELTDDIGGFTSPGYMMLLETGSGMFGGDNRNNSIDTTDVAFSIVHPVLVNNRDEGRQTISDCKKIAVEIVRRMMFDEDNGNTFLQDYDLTKTKYMRISGLPDNRMGIRVEFELKSNMYLVVDDAKWSDL